MRSLTRILSFLTTSVGLCLHSGAQVTGLISTDSSDVSANVDADSSNDPDCSSNGRWIAFSSQVPSLVPGDLNLTRDIFVKDRFSREVLRVSVATGGAEGHGASNRPAISADGRHIAFESKASDLVPGDGNGSDDVFVHDRDPDGNGIFDEGNQTTVRVSVTSGGQEKADDSGSAVISACGRYVVFVSGAKLDPSDSTTSNDVFSHDRDPDENGIYDEGNGVTRILSLDSNGVQGGTPSGSPAVSEDARFVAFTTTSVLDPVDTNGAVDVYLRDRDPDEDGVFDQGNGTTTLVSRNATVIANLYSAEPTVSADGRFIAFESDADNLVPGDTNGVRDVFRVELPAFSVVRISQGVGGSQSTTRSKRPSIDRSGDAVAFERDRNSTDPIVTDVFLHRVSRGITRQMNVPSFGTSSRDSAYRPDITADGLQVAFLSDATDLHPDDTAVDNDIFVHGPQYTFEIEPAVVTFGTDVSMRGWRGPPGSLAVLFVNSVNGMPFPYRLFPTTKFLDAQGKYLLEFTSNLTLMNLDVAIVLISRDLRGKFVPSNEAVLRLR